MSEQLRHGNDSKREKTTKTYLQSQFDHHLSQLLHPFLVFCTSYAACHDQLHFLVCALLLIARGLVLRVLVEEKTESEKLTTMILLWSSKEARCQQGSIECQIAIRQSNGAARSLRAKEVKQRR